MKKNLAWLIALSLVLTPAAFGAVQEKPPASQKPKQAEEKSKEDKESEKKAAEEEASALQRRSIEIIRGAADEAVSLTDHRNAARVQANAADVLWLRDEEHAREIFQKAFEAAVAHYRETKDDNREQLAERAWTTHPDMRLEVIRLASRRDAAFAKKFTEQYVEEKRRELQEQAIENQQKQPGYDRYFGKEDVIASGLLDAASPLLQTDPKTAVELALRAFSAGVPQGAPSFLFQLAGKDRAAADSLFLVALDHISRDPVVVPGQWLLLAAYPFGESVIYISDGQGMSSSSFGAPAPNPAVDPQLVGRYLASVAGMLTRAAQINPAQSPELPARIATALFAARLLEPKVVQYQPGLVDGWREMAQQLAVMTEQRSRDGVNSNVQNLNQNSKPSAPTDAEDRNKSLLDRAERTTDFGQRDELYRQVAFSLQRSDPARALSIADKISDLDLRKKTRSWISFQAATAAIGQKQWDEARRYAQEVIETDQRAYLYFRIAEAVLKNGDRTRAVELLDEAAQRAAGADNTAEKLRAQLGIANLYARFDSARGFEIAADAIKTANHVPTYNPDQAQLTRVFSTRGSTSVSTEDVDGFDLGKVLANLARADFDRAIALAQSLEPKPLKLTTLVTIASSVFDQKQMAQKQ